MNVYAFYLFTCLDFKFLILAYNLREEYVVNAGGDVDHQIVWKAMIFILLYTGRDQQPLCATTFSYGSATPNPGRRFSFLYFGDGNANYTYYKLPYYFSEHIVTKQESGCPLSETRLIDYTFITGGLIESMSDRGSILWEYEYGCK